MATFNDLPHEVRNKIYAHLITIPGDMPLIAVKVIQGTSPAEHGIIRDSQTFHPHQAEHDDALAALGLLRQVNSQLDEEVLEEFCHVNFITIRTNNATGPVYTTQDRAIPPAIILRFASIHLTAPRSNGYWPHLGGGPDLHVLISTTPSKDLACSERQLAKGDAVSSDQGAVVVATAASRLSGRKLSQSVLWSFICVLEGRARRA